MSYGIDIRGLHPILQAQIVETMDNLKRWHQRMIVGGAIVGADVFQHVEVVTAQTFAFIEKQIRTARGERTH